MPKPNQEDISQDYREAARGVRLRGFLASAFWKEDLGPYLEGVVLECQAGALVNKPNAELSVEKLALGTMFNSGRVVQVTDFREQLAIWLEQGKQAQERIDKREVPK